MIHLGDCREVMPKMEESSIDACITDPPYGLAFMGKEWDQGVPGVEVWSEVLRVLKPGSHLLAFGGTRTFHRLTCAIEDAGFEIRDCIMWVYGSGFPKSLDVSKAIDKAAGAEREILDERPAFAIGGNGCLGGHAKGATMKIDAGAATPEAAQWQGWGTALKPAWEPIIMARKPLSGTIAENVLRWGTGGINVDACRVECQGGSPAAKRREHIAQKGTMNSHDLHSSLNGRAGIKPYRRSIEDYITPRNGEQIGRWPANLIHDGSDEVFAQFPQENGESAARFFYCAKANKADRTENGRVENRHPTVKPTKLMRHLCRLVTPPGGTILDPFMGSGSTGKAARLEGFRFVGIEKDPEAFETARQRVNRPRQLCIG